MGTVQCQLPVREVREVRIHVSAHSNHEGDQQQRPHHGSESVGATTAGTREPTVATHIARIPNDTEPQRRHAGHQEESKLHRRLAGDQEMSELQRRPTGDQEVSKNLCVLEVHCRAPRRISGMFVSQVHSQTAAKRGPARSTPEDVTSKMWLCPAAMPDPRGSHTHMVFVRFRLGDVGRRSSPPPPHLHNLHCPPPTPRRPTSPPFWFPASLCGLSCPRGLIFAELRSGGISWFQHWSPKDI